MSTESDTSIVIIAYNAEDTIRRCLDSVVCQSGNIDIVIVDDGSCDGTKEIIKEFMIKDSRIRLFEHETNMGVMRARSDGVFAAKGKYTMFLDSDDCLVQGACEELHTIMESKKVDIIRYNSKVICVKDTRLPDVELFQKRLIPLLGHLYGEDIIKKQFESEKMWVLWNIYVDSDICKKAFGKLSQFNFSISDDAFSTFLIDYYANSYYGIDNIYHNYYLGSGYSDGHKLDRFDHFKLWIDTIQVTAFCISFLKKEGCYEKYRDYCNSYPLSSFDKCIELLNWLGDPSIKEKGKQIFVSNYLDVLRLDEEYYCKLLIDKSLLCYHYENSVIKELQRENMELQRNNQELEKKFLATLASKNELENSTVKATKNVVCSITRKLKKNNDNETY